MKVDFSVEDIAIIIMTNSRRRALEGALKEMGVELTYDPRGKITKLIHAKNAKGYEWKAVVAVLAPEKALQKWGRTIDSYVAMSRATEHLTVLRESDVYIPPPPRPPPRWRFAPKNTDQ